MSGPAARVLLAVLATALLGACSKNDEVISIGFIGGLSGRYADLGTDGRDGALLGVEQRNAQGGVNGQRVELLARDDAQDASKARQALDALTEANVAAVIGPVTSSMAVALVPRLELSDTVMIGVHTTTTELSERDDLFFRVIDDTRKYAGEVARFHFTQRKVRSVAIAYDLANVDYSESWVADYRRNFTALGGVVVRSIAFDSHYDRRYEAMAAALLEVEPDMVVIVANAVDTAELALKVRARNRTVQMAGSGWASTERLFQLGGQALEGMLLENYVNELDFSASYRQFREAFVARFKREPGYGAVFSYEAASIIMEGLTQNPDPKRLKKTLLTQRKFDGVQGDIRFDAYGDVQRPVYFAEVHNGRFSYFRLPPAAQSQPASGPTPEPATR